MAGAAVSVTAVISVQVVLRPYPGSFRCWALKNDEHPLAFEQVPGASDQCGPEGGCFTHELAETMLMRPQCHACADFQKGYEV